MMKTMEFVMKSDLNKYELVKDTLVLILAGGRGSRAAGARDGNHRMFGRHNNSQIKRCVAPP